MKTTSNDKVTIGRLGKTYGTKGWFHFYSYTTDDHFLSYSNWQIKYRKHWSTIEVESIKPHGKHWTIKLANIDTPETAQRYVNCEIGIHHADLPKLGNN